MRGFEDGEVDLLEQRRWMGIVRLCFFGGARSREVRLCCSAEDLGGCCYLVSRLVG